MLLQQYCCRKYHFCLISELKLRLSFKFISLSKYIGAEVLHTGTEIREFSSLVIMDKAEKDFWDRLSLQI